MAEQAGELSTPRISVVIPTHRRETRLSFALEALAHQTLAPDDFEVIVVRAHEGEQATPQDGLEVAELTAGAANIALQRNVGWRASSARLVAFMDDDCRPEPDWLERLISAYGGPHAILQGRTEPDPDEAHLYYGSARSMQVIASSRWYETCNIAYPRSLLEGLGGFDPELAFFGEDTDLGLRAEKAGARLIYVDEAVVRHAVHVRPITYLLRRIAERHDESTVLARHPELRDELYLQVFVSEEHARWVLAAAGMLLVKRSRRLALLCAYPYVIHRMGKRALNEGFLTPRGLARFAIDVGTGALLDGAEIVFRARSSLLARRLAL